MARAKKGATSKGKGGGGGRSPAWLWMVTGLAVGLFIAFLVFLGTHGKPSATTQSAAKETPKAKEKPADKPEKAETPTAANTAKESKGTTPGTAQSAKADPARPADKKPMNYDFYKKLPRFEVEVPEAKNGAHPKPLSDPGSYILQAGSFSSSKEAETRKAELAMLGIVSSIQVGNNADGKPAYHRVQIGPYRDLDKLNRVRQTLRENNIEFVTLKQRS